MFCLQENFSSQKLEQTMISGKSSTILDKIMTPCADFDSNSLKRRKLIVNKTIKSYRLTKLQCTVYTFVNVDLHISQIKKKMFKKLTKTRKFKFCRMCFASLQNISIKCLN